ncbi:MAG: hypothetical protein FWF49_01155, partial [Oscillospiraceae bacterium]|nr:hypothetical protein [Oscillospiraceae bacterium]
MKVTLYVSLSFNLLYAAFKLIAGVYYVSFWFSADAIFYIVLSIIRFTLLRHVREDEHDRKKGLLKYRLCGILLFVLNGAFIAVVYQIVRQGMRYEYRGPLIYAVAIYTFYCIIHSAVS